MPAGDIELVFCEHCGLIFNRSYDADRVVYTEGYENSLHFSEFFQGYIKDFAEQIAQRHNLDGKRVVEIGSGDGGFLDLLCEIGNCEGTGFDPSYPPDSPDVLPSGRAKVVREYYSKDNADAADLVVCRQVLEHVGDASGFLSMIREALGSRNDAGVVFEVPNSLYTLGQVSLWDVIYEHCTYWTQGSLARALSAAGFDVTHVSETYARQFIAVDGRPATAGQGSLSVEVDDLDSLRDEVRRFESSHKERIERWRRDLAADREAGRRVALWGTGARGVNFLNIADPGGVVEQVIDINPRKHGLHAAGTGQKIAPPDSLRDNAPDIVVVMNPNYVDEITASLHAMGLEPEVRLA